MFNLGFMVSSGKLGFFIFLQLKIKGYMSHSMMTFIFTEKFELI